MSVRELKILENFVTIFPIASFVPVVAVTVTTARMPFRSKSFTLFPELVPFARITGLFSLVLPLVIICIKKIDALGVVGALCFCAGWRAGWKTFWRPQFRITSGFCVVHILSYLAICCGRYTLFIGNFLHDAIAKARTITMRRIQIVAVVPGIVGDMSGFVLGNTTIIITAVGFLVLSELITASAPSGRAIPFIAVV